MNYSQKYLTNLIQSTNARSLPNKLNSVRAIPAYKGSMKPMDLLSAYVDTHYKEMNAFMRSPNYRQGFSDLKQSIEDVHFNNPYSRRRKNPAFTYDTPESVANQVVSVIPHLENAVKSDIRFEPNSRFRIDDPDFPNDPSFLRTGNNLLRGMSFNSPEELQQFMSKYPPGAIVDHPGFTSTTGRWDVANHFTDYHPNGGYGTQVQFEIDENPIWGGINAYKLSHPGGEELSEWLMPPGSRLKVNRIDNGYDEDSMVDKPTIYLQDAIGYVTPTEERTMNIMGRLKPRLASMVSDNQQVARQSQLSNYQQRYNNALSQGMSEDEAYRDVASGILDSLGQMAPVTSNRDWALNQITQSVKARGFDTTADVMAGEMARRNRFV